WPRDWSSDVCSSDLIASRQIAQLEAQVHRMRVPGEEHDRFADAYRALDLAQHGLLAGLDQPEAPQAEAVLLQHAQDQAVSRTAEIGRASWRESVEGR